MYSLIFLALVSFLAAFALTPLVREGACRVGLVDNPDDRRKIHNRPIPRLGGVAIAIAYASSFGALLLFDFKAGEIVKSAIPAAMQILPAAGLVFLTGVVDDIFGLRPWQKFSGQVIAALLAFWAGVRVTGFAGHLTDSWWSLPLTLLWLVGCANAFNLIDGLDGLAAGVGFFATVTTLAAALLHQNVALALATMPLAGALLGFLRYNFNPASIFLGDSGSLLIGFLLGCYGVLWSQKSATLLGMAAPVMILVVPLVDTTLSILRRFLRRQPLFIGDRGHIHHQLLERGFSPRDVALIMYTVCTVAATLSLLQSVAENHYAGLIIVIFCVSTWLGVQALGYVEFGVVGRLLSRGVFRQFLATEIQLQQLEERLLQAVDVHECWAVIQDRCGALGFTRARLHLAGMTYEVLLPDSGGGDWWEITIPISRSDYINFRRSLHTGKALYAASFVKIVRASLQARLSGMEREAGVTAGS